MTRIVSGFAGSIALAVPRSGTRPTSDRVREAMFSALDARDGIVERRVLDLYAGSGALGLEALSRGARSAALVERNPAAAALCRKNIEAVSRMAPRGRTLRASVSSQAVQSFLESTSSEFDLVFIDPPYDLGDEELARALASLVPRLSDDAVVMVERSTRSGMPSLPHGLELDREKKYGETTLWWLDRVVPAHGEAAASAQPTAPSQPA